MFNILAYLSKLFRQLHVTSNKFVMKLDVIPLVSALKVINRLNKSLVSQCCFQEFELLKCSNRFILLLANCLYFYEFCFVFIADNSKESKKM